MNWIVSLISGPLVSGILGAYKAKLEAGNTEGRIAADVAIEAIRAEVAAKQAQKELGIASMNHPIWWVAWCLFVIPVGLYHGGIYMLSVLSISPETYSILKVPAEQEAVGRQVVAYIFGAQTFAGVFGPVVKRFVK